MASKRMKDAQARDAASNVDDFATTAALDLMEYGVYVSWRELRDGCATEGVDVTKSRAQNALRKLHEAGRVTLSIGTKNGAPFYYTTKEQRAAWCAAKRADERERVRAAAIDAALLACECCGAPAGERCICVDGGEDDERDAEAAPLEDRAYGRAEQYMRSPSDDDSSDDDSSDDDERELTEQDIADWKGDVEYHERF